jgi:uncharacterized repeat protein (TIGR01451 family)
VGAVLHNVVFTDVVDSRLRIDAVGIVGQAFSLSYSGQVVTATFTTIPTYTQVTVIITATVRDLVTVTAGTQISDVAAFDYRDNPGGPISSNPVTVTVAEPNVTLDKSVQVPRDPLGAGDIVTYTLVLSNTGTWPAYDLVVTDSLPAGLSFVATAGFTVTDPVTATLGGGYPGLDGLATERGRLRDHHFHRAGGLGHRRGPDLDQLRRGRLQQPARPQRGRADLPHPHRYRPGADRLPGAGH